MNQATIDALRLAVEASVDCAIARNREDAEGYMQTARRERVVADAAWHLAALELQKISFNA